VDPLTKGGPVEKVGIHKGPYGPNFVKQNINLDENHKIKDKNKKIVNLEILKVKTWFGDKDLFS